MGDQRFTGFKFGVSVFVVSRFVVSGSGFHGLVFQVRGFGFGFWRFGVMGSRCRGSVLTVTSLGFRGRGFGFRVRGLGLRVVGSGFSRCGVTGTRFRGLGFRVRGF